MKHLLLAGLRLYRRLLSPVLGPACRFEPSCSAYAEEALHTHGVLRGVGLAVWRLLRCQPFARAGLDPVPPARPSLTASRPSLTASRPSLTASRPSPS
jgi:putative membrane protein insertion efficiency factor